jgi:methylated-DNA-[protein]-cysteine S-methyltransferase
VGSCISIVGDPATPKLEQSMEGVKSELLVFETALGTCGLRWNEEGVAEVLMPGSRELAGHHRTESPPRPLREAITRIVSLLEGESDDLCSIALDERALDDFSRHVYAATREIGPGSTATYGEIARAVGSPDAARAVGGALASNPFPIIVPCHRVLAADGALHGFSAPGGIATKRKMLEIERAPGFTQQALFA